MSPSDLLLSCQSCRWMSSRGITHDALRVLQNEHVIEYRMLISDNSTVDARTRVCHRRRRIMRKPLYQLMATDANTSSRAHACTCDQEDDSVAWIWLKAHSCRCTCKQFMSFTYMTSSMHYRTTYIQAQHNHNVQLHLL